MVQCKQCYICKETKPSNEFYKCTAKPDGLQRKCIVCAKSTYKVWWKKNKYEIADRQFYKRRNKQREIRANLYNNKPDESEILYR